MGSTYDGCVSVGYAEFYGLSVIVDSYALLFVSMAAHAAFLALLEIPRTSTLLFSLSLSRSRPFSYLHVQTSSGYTENASSMQSANPSLRCSNPPTSCYCPKHRCHPTQPLFLGHIRPQCWYLRGNGHRPRWTRV